MNEPHIVASFVLRMTHQAVTPWLGGQQKGISLDRDSQETFFSRGATPTQDVNALSSNMQRLARDRGGCVVALLCGDRIFILCTQ